MKALFPSLGKRPYLKEGESLAWNLTIRYFATLMSLIPRDVIPPIPRHVISPIPRHVMLTYPLWYHIHSSHVGICSSPPNIFIID